MASAKASESMKMTTAAPAPAHTPLVGDLTFLKDRRETGLAAIACPYPNTTIKIGGRQVGTIFAPRPRGESEWSISLMVVDPDAHCGWRTIRLAKRYPDEPAARLAMQGGDATLRARHHLHTLEA